MKDISYIVSGFRENIFSQITNLADKHGAISLSQGYPDFDGPHWVRQYAQENIEHGMNQTTSAIGTVSMRNALGTNYKKYYDLDYNADSEITVTVGATEAVFCSIMALVNPGDEVIIFEPHFDTYLPAVKLAGGKPVAVTLHAPKFSFYEDEFEKAFTEKTKLVILNSPHNPSGKIFNKKELELICKLVKKHDAYLVTDEVYEFLTYDEQIHIPAATLPGMRERTITISSTGKTFGLTGWRTGWACAPPKLSHAIRMVHQNNTFSSPHPLQEALAKALSNLDDYLPEFKKLYEQKRDFLYNGLKKAGFKPFLSKSTYFILCPITHLTDKNDVEFCKELIIERKVAAIPTSAFYFKSNEGEKHIRFCFAKKNETMTNAIKNLSLNFPKI
ncbi:MAG: aminotransferase class I/II-fold pyridoxal phosphate-dependent enzyme [Bacteriovoracaceae bacterium]|nr:aminotransferase class I/II-fold pyridoxal phosphate-dependent enzyme [Bacteriovoracaceae bacterium]